MSQQHSVLLDRLSRSRFRSRFHIRGDDLSYARRLSSEALRKHAERFVRERLAPARPRNDGRQTPYHGHPVFVAQHATATCCRGCLEKWHGIKRGRGLNSSHQAVIVSILMSWIDREFSTDATNC